MHTKKSKQQQQHTDAPAVPEFLRRLGVKESEWQYAAKGDFRFFMRPGNALRVRVACCIISQSTGYRRDVCVLQVKGTTKKDPPKLLPLWPGGIAGILHEVAIEAYQESGIVLSDADRERLKIHKGNIRAALIELEEDDGFLLRVRANCDPRKLIDEAIPLHEAIGRKLVTPIAELPHPDRAALHSKTLLYKLKTPKPARLKALERKEHSENEGVKFHSFEALPIERKTAQLLMRFLGAAGLPKDPATIARIAERPEVKTGLAGYTERVREAAASFTEILKSIAAAGGPSAEPQEEKQDAAALPRPAAAAGGPSAEPLKYALFHERLVRAFHRAHLPVPGQRQTRPIFQQLPPADRETFAAAVTAELLMKRHVKNPGILPALAEEFTAAPAEQPDTAAMIRSNNPNVRRRGAELIIKNAAAATPQELEDAHTVLLQTFAQGA